MARITPQEAAGIASTGNIPMGDAQRIHHRTKTVGGVEVFYREAGPKAGPRCSCCTASQPPATCSGR